MGKQSEVEKTIPAFIEKLEKAKNESEISKACEELKATVDRVFDKTEGRRDPKTMAAIRKAIKARFPDQLVDAEVADDFPYYFTNKGQGHIKRLEHLAYKHLEDERNKKTEQPSNEPEQEPVKTKPETKQPNQGDRSEQKTPRIKPNFCEVSLESFGLSSDEKEIVKRAIGESDIKEWVKQAIMQRANAINNKAAVMDEDLTEVPSEVLMSDKRYRTNPTAARELTNRAVRVVKQWNHDHPDQKWCITNKLIGELTGVTVKAIAKAVEGMDLESYNKSHELTPVVNRLIKGSIGEASKVMSIAKVTGIEGSEVNYKPS